MTAPQQVPPLALVQPTQLATAVTTGQAPDGTRFVMLRVESATGSFVMAMPIDVARQLAEQLAEAAAGPRHGLIVPTPLVPG